MRGKLAQFEAEARLFGEDEQAEASQLLVLQVVCFALAAVLYMDQQAPTFAAVLEAGGAVQVAERLTIVGIQQARAGLVVAQALGAPEKMP